MLKAASLLAEQDFVAPPGSDTRKLVAAARKSGLANGIKAGNIIKAVAKALDGGGGGKPDLAQGGGPSVICWLRKDNLGEHFDILKLTISVLFPKPLHPKPHRSAR